MRRNLSSASQKINSLIRTSYTKPNNFCHTKKNNEPITIKSAVLNKNNYNNYKPRIFDKNALTPLNLSPLGRPQKKIIRSHSALKTDTWDAMISRTSPIVKPKRINYIKTNLSNVFPNNNYFPESERRLVKNTPLFSEYNIKTQITTLPGGVKREKNFIRDDVFVNKKSKESHLIKMINEFNSNVSYDQAEPIGQGYNVNCFPVKERYYGSYKKGVVENDLFNRKKIYIPPEKFTRKKLYANIKFASQIKLV